MVFSFDPRASTGFCCAPLPTGDGYTWSLTTQLGALLREAESRFGSRNKDWTILGIEFCGDTPRVWYPGSCQHISILLSDSAAQNPQRALFQLAHEIIHLLEPSGRNSAPVIEEGVAAIFSDEIAFRYDLGYLTGGSNYLEAMRLTRDLVKSHPEAIKKLRALEPNFEKFTSELIRGYFTDVSEELAVSLCRPFSELPP